MLLTKPIITICWRYISKQCGVSTNAIPRVKITAPQICRPTPGFALRLSPRSTRSDSVPVVRRLMSIFPWQEDNSPSITSSQPSQTASSQFVPLQAAAPPSSSSYQSVPPQDQLPSMVRAQQQDYIRSPLGSLPSHQSSLSAVASSLCQGLGPASQSVPVVVRNAAAPNTTLSEGSEAASIEEEGGSVIQRGFDGANTERNLSYMPMPVGTPQAREGTGSSALTSRPSTARGVKRAHEMDGENDGDTPRKHGKRLTTKEEISLFEICNRHADSFGKRSDICNWWKTVSDEFTQAHGRPYSWHSVRRKVEMVTKQRVKFLDDQRQRQRDLSGPNLVGDLMHPQWCAVLDTWIPTWQRWEEAEARRILKRDEMLRRRSHGKSQPEPVLGRIGIASPASPDEMCDAGHLFPDNGANSAGDAIPITHHTTAMTTHAVAVPLFETSSTSTINKVKLPPGFETMFSDPQPQSTKQPTPPTPAPAPAQTSTSTTSASPNNSISNAVLETLSKLNKHLDAASSSSAFGSGGTDPRSSPVISALVQAASESAQHFAFLQDPQQPQTASIDIDRIKEELRQEMQAELRRELERDRAALEEKLDSVQRTQELILEMLRQEPA